MSMFNRWIKSKYVGFFEGDPYEKLYLNPT